MNEWMDPSRRRSMRKACDDIEQPFASHPDCAAILGVYHEGKWLVTVSAQTKNPHQHVRVVVGVPTFAPAEEGRLRRQPSEYW